MVVAALLLGALVVALLPLRHEDDGAEVVAPSPPGAAVSAFERLVARPMPVAPPGPALVSTPSLATLPANPANPAAAAATAATPLAAASIGAAVASGTVVFKAKGESWIQVTDARGGVPLRKLLAAGESAGASGPLPLAVTVGSVSATDVQVRGKPFDLAPVSRDNVARFEVK